MNYISRKSFIFALDDYDPSIIIINYFLFTGTMRENMEVRGSAEIKMFCKDYVEHAEVMFILASVSCFIVIISLVHFLMALSANYAHIRGHGKFAELQDLHDLTSETLTLTERDPYHIK